MRLRRGRAGLLDVRSCARAPLAIQGTGSLASRALRSLGQARLSSVCCVAVLAAGAVSCAGIEHTFDDLGSVHHLQTSKVVHRFEVERYNWFHAQLLWGWPGGIPGVRSIAERSEQRLDDPADFCWSRVRDLAAIDLADLTQVAEATYWAGVIAEDDPFPLSRIDALRALARIARRFPIDFEALQAVDRDYQQATLTRLTQLTRLLQLPFDETLTDEQRREFIAVVKPLSETRYARSAVCRVIARNFSMALTAVPDRDVGLALTSGIELLVPRAAIQQLTASLADGHERVRIAAATELLRAAGPSAAPWLVERMREDPQPSVRMAVVALVGDSARLADPAAERCLAYLADATRDPESAVSVNAMEALGRITGIGRQFDVDWWRRWWDHRVREERDARPGASPARAAAPRTGR